MKLNGAKQAAVEPRTLRSVETNSKLDMYVTALLPHGVKMMMMMNN